MARTCDRRGCTELAEIRVGWIPASESVQEDRLPLRSWFYGCKPHARWLWKQATSNQQSPVYTPLASRQ